MVYSQCTELNRLYISLQMPGVLKHAPCTPCPPNRVWRDATNGCDSTAFSSQQSMFLFPWSKAVSCWTSFVSFTQMQWPEPQLLTLQRCWLSPYSHTSPWMHWDLYFHPICSIYTSENQNISIFQALLEKGYPKQREKQDVSGVVY